MKLILNQVRKGRTQPRLNQLLFQFHKEPQSWMMFLQNSVSRICIVALSVLIISCQPKEQLALVGSWEVQSVQLDSNEIISCLNSNGLEFNDDSTFHLASMVASDCSNGLGWYGIGKWRFVSDGLNTIQLVTIDTVLADEYKFSFKVLEGERAFQLVMESDRVKVIALKDLTSSDFNKLNRHFSD